MFTLAMFVLAFSSTFQYSKCENTQYQNAYQYPQNMARQTSPQVDMNGNPIMPGGGIPGAPMGGQVPQGGMPTTGGNQINPQTGMPNQQFPQQNPGFAGPNQQFPQNQQFPLNHGPVPGTNAFSFPQPPHDLHLNREGIYAYGYIMHTIEAMLNDPTARNNLFYLFNNLQTVMSNPRSSPIIQEFFNRWSHAVGMPLGMGQAPTNVVVQNVPSSGSFLDVLKRKGSALVNLASDVAMAKTKALNSLFDNSIFSPAVQVGTNWANSGMQAVQGAMSPIIGSNPSTTGQTLVTPAVNSPLSMTTPVVSVH